METLDTGSGGEIGNETLPTSDRERARERLQTRRDFASHVVAYIVINAFLVGAWALTGGGYFWPAWVMAGWGAGLVLHAWEAFMRRPITESDVDGELQRLGR
jgi:2TM domain